MFVVFVSQCEKKALNRTRRVLDAFADRIGDNTWQTVITQEGLLAVKKLLRKTATKNTAVSCHWIRSRSRSELVWIVGNKSKFNEQGIVPVNYTKREYSYRDDLNDWKHLPVIRALTCLAALLHDWGKANARFQEKLSKEYKGTGADRLRHEWVSCLLLKAVIGQSPDPESDEGWLTLLKNGDINERQLIQTDFEQLEPLVNLPPVAKLMAWLIVTHHKLPIHADNHSGSSCSSLDSLLHAINRKWGYENINAGSLNSCLQFPKGLLSNSGKWLSQVKRWSKKLLEYKDLIKQVIEDGSFRVILHHSRLCLMLGDHYYSSLDITQTPQWQQLSELVANTQKSGDPKQALDQHLVGVYESAKNNVNKLPLIESAIEPSFNTAELQRKSPKQFAWQDTAAKKVRAWRQACGDTKKGFFAVNMASTGCGKTFANAKVMMALSEDGDSLRYVLALGLRTLTLQTGDEYRNRIFTNSDGSDLGVLVGSKAIIELHEQSKVESAEVIKQGSESAEALLDESEEVYYDCDIPEDGMSTILTNQKDKKLLYAPVLACTIDHIIGATETVKGGRYILPALRLLSSDLVIDEVDDFTGSDLIAIGRLIHLAGMLGRKVMISSATIPPALAEGYFNAYREGWHLFSKTRNATNIIGCAWIDEFSTHVEEHNSSEMARSSYRSSHDEFVEKRAEKLQKQPAKRKAIVIDCENSLSALPEDADQQEDSKKACYFTTIAREAVTLHQHHHITDHKTNLAVSFGVIRTANINPCIELTQYLLDYEWPQSTDVRIMAYHSRQVLLLRHEQEQHLDSVLKRKEKPGEQPVALSNPVIRNHLDQIHKENSLIKNVMFIVVATPVEEVGRDHDFDWAIVEPSSYRSIIQLAGRVKRHRAGEVSQPNIGILQYNWRTIKLGDEPGKPRFIRPGYEEYAELKNGKKGCMKSHNLKKIVDTQAIAKRLDAIPRIQIMPKSQAPTKMALLEHAVIASELTFYEGKGPDTLQGYLQWYWYLTALPQLNNRFRKSRKTVQLYRVLGSRDHQWFTERDTNGKVQFTVNGEPRNIDSNYRIKSVELTPQQVTKLWLHRDYVKSLHHQCELSEVTLYEAALRFGELTIDAPNEYSTKEYEYNDQFGLYRKE